MLAKRIWWQHFTFW